jgi:cbb3-type cytochrome oxidase maturation protein
LRVENQKENMSVLFVLVGASLVLAIGFLIAFLLSVKSGQYDDEYTPSVRILLDDQPLSYSPKNKNEYGSRKV